MLRHDRILIIISLFITQNLHSQTGVIEGSVHDALSAQPLQGVSIYMPSDSKALSSDALGHFKIDKVIPGAYELVVSHIGYQTSVIPVQIKQNVTAWVEVEMKRAGLDLKEIKLTSRKSNGNEYLPAIDIMLRPVNTSQDVLKMVPGLFIAQHAGGGKAEQIFLRGFDIDHGTDFLVEVDGVPVNAVSHAHGQGYADLHFLVPETIEKVDFDKGPYETSKGNFATAGWADFKTRDFLDHNMVKTELGSFNVKRLVALQKLFSKTTAESKQQLYAAGEYFISDGYFDTPQDFHRKNFMLRYTAMKNNKSSIRIKASYFDSKWDASGQVPDRAVRQGIISRFGSIDDSEGGQTHRKMLTINHTKKLNNGGNLMSNIFFNNYFFDLYSNFTFYLEDSVYGDGISQRENRNTWGFSTTYSQQYSTGSLRSELKIGTGLRSDAINDINLARTFKRQYLNTIQQGDIREQNFFAFAEQQVYLSSRLTATAGIRVDYFQFGYKNLLAAATAFQRRDQWLMSPKLNFIYNVNERLNFYLKTGYGFHSNDSRVIIDQHTDKVVPSIYSTDLGLSAKLTGNLLLKAAVWHIYAQQEFVYVGDGGFVEPGGRSKRLGADISIRQQFNKWLFGDIDLNIAHARAIDEVKGADYIPLAPSFTSTGGLSVKSKDGINGSIRYRYIDDRPADEFNAVQAAGYMLFDAIASYEHRKFTASFSIENILNRDWREAQFNTTSRLQQETIPVTEIHFTPGSPRFLKVALTYKF